MSWLRAGLELIGVIVAVTLHLPIAYFYALGSGLVDVRPAPYWAAIGFGYLAMVAAALSRSRALSRVPARQRLDAWLLTLPVAAALAAALIAIEWSLRFASWDGHGFGAAGGEANSVFFPWFHTALWVVSCFGAGRLRRGDHNPAAQ